jgi:hypothetical protein
MRNQAEPWNFAAIKTPIRSINRDSPEHPWLSIAPRAANERLNSATIRPKTAVTARIADYIVRTARNRALPSATRS